MLNRASWALIPFNKITLGGPGSLAPWAQKTEEAAVLYCIRTVLPVGCAYHYGFSKRKKTRRRTCGASLRTHRTARRLHISLWLLKKKQDKFISASPRTRTRNMWVSVCVCICFFEYINLNNSYLLRSVINFAFLTQL